MGGMEPNRMEQAQQHNRISIPFSLYAEHAPDRFAQLIPDLEFRRGFIIFSSVRDAESTFPDYLWK
jgi:hypothetical protein